MVAVCMPAQATERVASRGADARGAPSVKAAAPAPRAADPRAKSAAAGRGAASARESASNSRPAAAGGRTAAPNPRAASAAPNPRAAAAAARAAAAPTRVKAVGRAPQAADGRAVRAAPASASRAVVTGQRNGRMVKASFAPRAVEPARPSIGQAIGLHLTEDPLDLRSSVAMVIDQQTGETLYSKNPEAVLPIASITKVMTAMVVLDAGLSMHEMVEITEADRDTERHTGSRLQIGARLSRGELMQLSLMSSENRAAAALGRAYPGGSSAFVAAMNAKAQSVGMVDSRFADPTGLSSANMSNARDLARLVRAAYGYPEIRAYSTATDLTVDTGYRQLTFRTTNRLVDDPAWSIGMQKTGFISEAGKCLVMQARVDGRSVIMVLLDARAGQARFADAQRLRRWVAENPRIETTVRADTRS
jgi:D-alanyl-D-alanine endopeptidase (penicillin-binding protein 7)